MELFHGVITVTGIPLFLLSIFLIVLVGLLIGRITVAGVSLGHAAVFLVALLFGCLWYPLLRDGMLIPGGSESYAGEALKAIETLGLVLFVTSVGFLAGPRFFGNLKRNFRSYVLIALVVVLTGGIVAVGCIFFGRHVMGESDYGEFTAMIVGILSGALTSTPAFSAAKASVLPIYESAVVVGHGIAYIFGVVGKVLFVQLVPKLSRADMALERQKLHAVMERNDPPLPKRAEKRRFLIDGLGLAAFALAAVVGILIGMIRIPLSGEGLSGACFSLTITGGCLLAALVLGHFGSIGGVVVAPGESTLKLFREWGLILFLVGAGVAGGAEFIALFRGIYFVYGVVMTVIPMLVGFFFAKYVLKTCLLNNLGSLTGGMTSTPALGTLVSVSGTEEVGAAYAATYPVALILVVLLSEVLVLVF